MKLKALGIISIILAAISSMLGIINLVMLSIPGIKEATKYSSGTSDYIDRAIMYPTGAPVSDTFLYKIIVILAIASVVMFLTFYFVNGDTVSRILMLICKVVEISAIVTIIVMDQKFRYNGNMYLIPLAIIILGMIGSFVLYCKVELNLLAILVASLSFVGILTNVAYTLVLIVVFTIVVLIIWKIISLLAPVPAPRLIAVFDSVGNLIGFMREE